MMDMSIDRTDIVDLAGMGQSAKVLRLVIYDHLPWDVDFEVFHLELLQEKMNAYLAFIDGKDYLKTYPTFKPEGFTIEIQFKHVPTATCMEFLTNAYHLISTQRKAKSKSEEIFIIAYPPRNDKGPCETGYVIEFYPEDDVNHLLDWSDMLTFDIRDYANQESSDQTLPNSNRN